MAASSSNVIYTAQDQLLIVQPEASYAVAAAADAANAVMVEEVSVSAMEGDVQDLNSVKGFHGSGGKMRISTYCAADITVKLGGAKDGSATTPVPYNNLFLGCSTAATVEADRVAYSMVSDGLKSLSIFYYAGPVLHQIVGSLGNVEFNLGTDGIPRAVFKFTGLFVTPGKAVQPAGVDFSGVQNPLAPNKRNLKKVEFMGHEIRMNQLTVTPGNNVVYANLAYQEQASITGRSGTITAKFLEPDPDVINFWDLAESNAVGTLDYLLGDMAANAGHVFGLNVPNLQLENCTRGFENEQAFLTVTAVIVPTTKNTDMTFFTA